jgi:hypothetical protein
MRRAAFTFLALLLLSTASSAQSWVDSIFPEPSHDFGTVARGSRVKHAFRLVNTTNYDLHIADWRTKCGCTEVKVGARDIPPGTQTFIEATLDTTRFQGTKNSGLTLIFDRPGYAEKDLNFSSYIRGDVLLNPGAADFGHVNRSAEVSLALQLTYLGGMTNWGVTRIQTISPHLTARLEEIEGSRTAGSVQYRLTAQLKKTVPTGYFKDEITLETNDPSSPTIPVSVTANVQGALQVSPSPLMLGQLKPGQEVTKDVLVRSGQAFQIKEAVARQGDLSATTGSDSPRTIQKLTVKLKAPEKPGPFYGYLELQTSIEGEPPVKLPAFANIVR